MDKSRFRRVMDALAEMGADQMLITDPKSIFYLTGYDNFPHERFMGLLLKRSGDNVFFLNNLFMPPEEEDTARVWYSDTDPVMDMVAEHIDHSSVLGVDKDIKARFLLPLMEKGAAAGFINSSLAVDTTRGIKDDDEKTKMRRASQINDAAMAEFRALVKEGVTEKEIEEQMLDIYLKLGAEGFSFDPIVSFGANAADPHHSPDGTVLKKGDVVLFDVGCIADGYCSDMTRTFVFQEVSDLDRKVYEIVKKANQSAVEKIKPGVPIHVLDDTARGIIADAGYGEYFTHRLGHFIGLETHEYGDVSAVNETLLKPGMIFSIEPGIYLPGETGVRIEDLVMVTEDGAEVLNHYSRELTVIR